VAGGTMFLRLLLIVAILNHQMGPALALPLGVMAATCLVGAAVLWFWRADGTAISASPPLTNPFDLATALKFGLFLGIILLLSGQLQQWYGNQGLYLLAALSGLADVDAISVSMAKLAQQGTITLPAAANGVLIAAFVNTTVKGVIVAILCAGTMIWRVGAVFIGTLAAGLLCLYLA
jgi:uncharacterized membrane protein (DUF4010 family)